jgi:hypothetical protein
MLSWSPGEIDVLDPDVNVVSGQRGQSCQIPNSESPLISSFSQKKMDIAAEEPNEPASPVERHKPDGELDVVCGISWDTDVHKPK